MGSDVAGTEITAWSGGAAEPALDHVAAAFHKATGHTVKVTYNLGAQGLKRMDQGEIFDVIIATSHSIKRNFLATGKVEEGGLSIGRVGLGMMVRPQTPVPDISSVAGLKRALLEAEAILNTRETSGLCIEEMIRKLGIYEQVASKITRFNNGPALMDRVLSGKGKEIAFLPITLIGTYKDKGLKLVGPLPEEVQHYLELVAVPSARSTQKEIGWAFVRFCAGPGKSILVAHGVS